MPDPHPELLIVEDDEMSRDVLSRRLARCGYAVAAAADGVEGLVRAQVRPPALILLDLRLPFVDGFEVARRLEADPATRGIPIIALSGYVPAEDRSRVLAAGFDEFVRKPVDFPQLLGIVERMLAAKAL